MLLYGGVETVIILCFGCLTRPGHYPVMIHAVIVFVDGGFGNSLLVVRRATGFDR